MTQAELRALLRDCLMLWSVHGELGLDGEGITIATATGAFAVSPAPLDMRPVRWLLQTPERRAANRPPRAAPSIVALLSALRHALGGEGGATLRIGV